MPIEISSSARAEIVHNEKACVGCGICVDTCPSDVLRQGPDGLPRVAYLEDCQLCFLCQIDCPREAIHLHFQGVRNAYRLA